MCVCVHTVQHCSILVFEKFCLAMVGWLVLHVDALSAMQGHLRTNALAMGGNGMQELRKKNAYISDSWHTDKCTNTSRCDKQFVVILFVCLLFCLLLFVVVLGLLLLLFFFGGGIVCFFQAYFFETVMTWKGGPPRNTGNHHYWDWPLTLHWRPDWWFTITWQ